MRAKSNSPSPAQRSVRGTGGRTKSNFLSVQSYDSATKLDALQRLRAAVHPTRATRGKRSLATGSQGCLQPVKRTGLHTSFNWNQLYPSPSPAYQQSCCQRLSPQPDRESLLIPPRKEPAPKSSIGLVPPAAPNVARRYAILRKSRKLKLDSQDGTLVRFPQRLENEREHKLIRPYPRSVQNVERRVENQLSLRQPSRFRPFKSKYIKERYEN